MRKRGLKSVVMMAAGAVALMSAGVAKAVTFNLTNLGGAETGSFARQGFDVATRYWSSVLTDNITVNLDIGFSSLPNRVLGSTRSYSSVVGIAETDARLRADQTSRIDADAVAGRQPLQGGAVTAVVNAFSDPATRSGYTDTGTRIDNDRSDNNRFLDMNNANLKALGFLRDANGVALDYGARDGSIQFSSDYKFDFDPTDGIATGQIDFIGVAIHEIGHALGFVSGVDTYDFYTNPGSPEAGTLPDGTPYTYGDLLAAGLETDDGSPNLEGYAIASTLDLFRYNGDGQLDWSTSDGTKYFSVNGRTPVYGNGAFSLGSFNGDGNQASHWLQPADQSTTAGACSNFLGIMNPYICGGKTDAVTGLDLAAMDAIGYDLSATVRDRAAYNFSTADAYRAFATAVPETATWAQFILGFGMLGAFARRRGPLANAVA